MSNVPAHKIILCDLIEAMDARLGGQYVPSLDDLQRAATELRWQLWHA